MGLNSGEPAHVSIHRTIANLWRVAMAMAGARAKLPLSFKHLLQSWGKLAPLTTKLMAGNLRAHTRASSAVFQPLLIAVILPPQLRLHYGN